MTLLAAIATATRAAARAVPALQRAQRNLEQARAALKDCTLEIKNAERLGTHMIRKRHLWAREDELGKSMPRLIKAVQAAEFRLFKAQNFLVMNTLPGDGA